jgi:hypothetical protein
MIVNEVSRLTGGRCRAKNGGLPASRDPAMPRIAAALATFLTVGLAAHAADWSHPNIVLILTVDK